MARKHNAVQRQVRSELRKLEGLSEEEIYLEVARKHRKVKLSDAPQSCSYDMERFEISEPKSGRTTRKDKKPRKKKKIPVGRTSYSTVTYPNSEQGEMLIRRVLRQLKDLICDDWDYCGKRKDYKDDFKFISAAASMAVKALSLEASLVTAALLIATYKGPDFFCKCSKRESKKNVKLTQSSLDFAK